MTAFVADKDLLLLLDNFEHLLAEVGSVAPVRYAPSVTVLVKGSRSARMERIVAAQCGETDQEGSH